MNRVVLVSCQNEKENKLHKNFWCSGLDFRSGCILRDLFSPHANGIEFVCFISDNEINDQNTDAEKLFCETNISLACSTRHVLLFELACFENEIETYYESNSQVSESNTQEFIQCALNNCPQIVCHRYDIVPMGRECGHSVCKRHFLSAFNKCDSNEIDSHLKVAMQENECERKISLCKVAVDHFMHIHCEDSSPENCMVDNGFLCPMCFQKGDIQFEGNHRTWDELSSQIGEDVESLFQKFISQHQATQTNDTHLVSGSNDETVSVGTAESVKPVADHTNISPSDLYFNPYDENTLPGQVTDADLRKKLVQLRANFLNANKCTIEELNYILQELWPDRLECLDTAELNSCIKYVRQHGSLEGKVLPVNKVETTRAVNFTSPPVFPSSDSSFKSKQPSLVSLSATDPGYLNGFTLSERNRILSLRSRIMSQFWCKVDEVDRVFAAQPREGLLELDVEFAWDLIQIDRMTTESEISSEGKIDWVDEIYREQKASDEIFYDIDLDAKSHGGSDLYVDQADSKSVFDSSKSSEKKTTDALDDQCRLELLARLMELKTKLISEEFCSEAVIEEVLTTLNANELSNLTEEKLRDYVDEIRDEVALKHVPSIPATATVTANDSYLDIMSEIPANIRQSLKLMKSRLVRDGVCSNVEVENVFSAMPVSELLKLKHASELKRLVQMRRESKVSQESKGLYPVPPTTSYWESMGRISSVTRVHLKTLQRILVSEGVGSMDEVEQVLKSLSSSELHSIQDVNDLTTFVHRFKANESSSSSRSLNPRLQNVNSNDDSYLDHIRISQCVADQLRNLKRKVVNDFLCTPGEVDDVFKSTSIAELAILNESKLLQKVHSNQRKSTAFCSPSREIVDLTLDDDLTLFCPELNKSVEVSRRVLFQPPVDLNIIKGRVCKATGYDAEIMNALPSWERNMFNIVHRLVLCKVDHAGWSVEIGDICSNDSQICHYAALESGDRIEIRRDTTSNIGGKFRLDYIAAENRESRVMHEKIQALSKNFVGFRKIRGDGNCYYRAVIYGLIEYIYLSGKKELWLNILNQFKEITFTYEDVDYGRNLTVNDLNKLHNDLLKEIQHAIDRDDLTLEEFQANMLSECTSIDESLVRACKKVVTRILLADQDKVYNEMSVKDAILFTYDDISSVNGFCKKYVLQMETYAEGIHVNLGLLPSALGCHCNIIILPHRDEDGVTTINAKCADVQVENPFTLNLLLRPGHYDLLYTEDISGMLPAINNESSVNEIQESGTIETSRVTTDEKTVTEDRPENPISPFVVISPDGECSGSVFSSLTRPRSESRSILSTIQSIASEDPQLSSEVTETNLNTTTAAGGASDSVNFEDVTIEEIKSAHADCFSEVIVLNDCPFQIRRKLTHSLLLADIEWEYDVKIHIKGSYIAPETKTAREDEKLTLVIEGKSHKSVREAHLHIITEYINRSSGAVENGDEEVEYDYDSDDVEYGDSDCEELPYIDGVDYGGHNRSQTIQESISQVVSTLCVSDDLALYLLKSNHFEVYDAIVSYAEMTSDEKERFSAERRSKYKPKMSPSKVVPVTFDCEKFSSELKYNSKMSPRKVVPVTSDLFERSTATREEAVKIVDHLVSGAIEFKGTNSDRTIQTVSPTSEMMRTPILASMSASLASCPEKVILDPKAQLLATSLSVSYSIAVLLLKIYENRVSLSANAFWGMNERQRRVLSAMADRQDSVKYAQKIRIRNKLLSLIGTSQSNARGKRKSKLSCKTEQKKTEQTSEEKVLWCSQQDHSFMNDQRYIDVFWYLVIGLKMEAHFVMDILVKRDVQSVYGVLYVDRHQKLGISTPGILPTHVSGPREDDAELIQVINTVVNDLQFDRSEVFDAMVFDVCLTVEDIVEIVSEALEFAAVNSIQNGLTYAFAFNQAISPLWNMVRMVERNVYAPQSLDLPCVETVNRLGRNSLVEVMKILGIHNVMSIRASWSTQRLRRMLIQHIGEKYQFIATRGRE